MRWPWPPPTRGDIIGTLLVLFFIAAAAIGFIARPFPLHKPGFGAAFGLGPDWDCVYAAKGRTDLREACVAAIEPLDTLPACATVLSS
jgi:hypothetical protein